VDRPFTTLAKVSKSYRANPLQARPGIYDFNRQFSTLIDRNKIVPGN